MAQHLAKIFGTEEDKVNCPFYLKMGACRHGDRCSRIHNRPILSQTILLQNMVRPLPRRPSSLHPPIPPPPRLGRSPSPPPSRSTCRRRSSTGRTGCPSPRTRTSSRTTSRSSTRRALPPPHPQAPPPHPPHAHPLAAATSAAAPAWGGAGWVPCGDISMSKSYWTSICMLIFVYVYCNTSLV